MPHSARTFTTPQQKSSPQSSRLPKQRAKTQEPKKSEPTTSTWNTYRTRFLVRARQLTKSLVFTDSLGREHCGCAGDYLVPSNNGMLRIAPREIFEDVYVVMEAEKLEHATMESNQPNSSFSPAPVEHPHPFSATDDMHI